MPTVDATTTPPELARELGHDDGGKAIRRWIRVKEWRPEVEKNSRWHLTPAQADAVRYEFRSR